MGVSGSPLSRGGTGSGLSPGDRKMAAVPHTWGLQGEQGWGCRGGVPLSGASPGRRGALPAPARPLSALVAAAQGSLSPNPNIMRTRLPSASPAPHMLLDWRGWELEWGDVGGDSTGPQPFLAPPDPQSHGEDWMRGAGGQLTGSLGGRPPPRRLPALSPLSPRSCGCLLHSGVCSLLRGGAPHAFSVGAAFRSVCVPGSTRTQKSACSRQQASLAAQHQGCRRAAPPLPCL